ncbi:hydrolase [Clostridia bacterium]|nr:hydrolase [Clostridia bacterium]
MDFDKLRSQVGGVLDEKRMKHVLGVEEEAVRLARRWGENEDDARTAALLHDVTKLINHNQQLKLCEKYGIVLDDVESSQEKLLHAITGAEVAADVYGAGDRVREAIRWHTTGRAGMSLLEKIIYMADYIEPGRTFEGVEGMRAEAYVNLESALVMGLDMAIAEQITKGRVMHISSIEARNSLLAEASANKSAASHF